MRLVQIAQHANDLTRAGQFHAALLGVEARAVFDPPGFFFDLDGVRLLLEAGAPSALVYLTVPDVRETVTGLRGRGVEIVEEPGVIFSHADDRFGPAGTDEWMAFIRDSEGNTVGPISQLPHERPASRAIVPRITRR